MNDRQLIAIALVLGGAAAALWFFVLQPQEVQQEQTQARLDREGGEDLQPANQRVEDPLGKTLGVQDSGG